MSVFKIGWDSNSQFYWKKRGWQIFLEARRCERLLTAASNSLIGRTSSAGC
jgi:hypothetical protein